MGRVAFEGSMAAGSSGTSTSSVSAAKMKKPVSSDAIGISVLDETLDNTHLDVEEPIQWPPVIESTMQPMCLPFGRPPKHFSVTDDEAGGAVFCDELGNFIVQDDDLFFIQLPTTLPATKDDDDAPVKPANKDAEGLELFDNALNTMPSGYLGKIQIHKSGKAVLVLGDKTFDIAPAQPPTFYEELVSMDTKDRLLSHLGPVANHLVVTPDFESLLA
ncbi:hypothetical protein SPRG_07421 [Saprolegnia parasitica CBS 223.65]|uniref:Uncharacterized protein n=1 Tax=Saprolegnia parasitica (strain CBS 223.65) TaxID=695850 RepID=A0A067C9N9_SAPPC|nr:hypothetical protein SPRG_07421 [Saprolegnia parasitica CBS 223.65]KDO27173.1 hypothetical protein SPRG_07421 [Saprolegnia parasitica CBS 223.65]|eukprot:XP_012201952.1 hypothetical protein SPRG_07421 [Saprolegnia parasitica CBS 223.65]